jgi:hypothetical protein
VQLGPREFAGLDSDRAGNALDPHRRIGGELVFLVDLLARRHRRRIDPLTAVGGGWAGQCRREGDRGDDRTDQPAAHLALLATFVTAFKKGAGQFAKGHGSSAKFAPDAALC